MENEKSASPPAPGLTLDKVREIYSRTYSDEGKPDFSHIFPYYHPDMHFQDCIQVIEGKEEFIKMCNRLAKRCSELYMTIHDVAQSGNVVFIQWTQTLRYMKTPLTPLYGVTKLTLNDEGLIIDHRDHFDIWGDIIDAIPGIGKLYRLFMRIVMG